MKKIVLTLAIFVTLVFGMSLNAEAALLGVDLKLPDILSNTTGGYSYNANTGLVTFHATPLTITFDGVSLVSITGTRSYSADFYVDNSGNLVGGTAGNDLEIYGDIDVNGDAINDYSGLLLAGEITAFGWDKGPGSYALFDYRFDVTDGDLAGFYASGVGGDISLSEVSNFTGSWATDHSGIKTKHDTAPTPEPASLALLGLGLVGFASSVIRKKFMA